MRYGQGLRCSVVGRNARSITVVSDATQQRTTIEDLTGDVELLLWRLREGRTCEQAVADMTAHRDGVSPAAVWAALAGLERLGLLGLAQPEGAGAKVTLAEPNPVAA